MATIRLVPSAYSVSSSSVSVSNASNMYNNTDHTSSYATLTHSNKSTSTYYVYINGFNFGSLPSGAVVSSFEVKIKGYESNMSTSSSYAPRLVNGTSSISGTTASSNFSTSTNTITIPTGSLSWSTISDYGNDFGVSVLLRRSSKNTQGYVYVYGVEILVTYTIPISHTITSSTDAGTINPSGTVTVNEGDSYSLSISGVRSPRVTDNGVDVTSQLTQTSSGTSILIPDGNTSSGFSVSDISNAYTDATSSTSAALELSGGVTGTIYLDIENLGLPSSATINSVSCSAKLGYSSGGSGSSFTASCQMYAGSTAKGSSITVVSSASTNISSQTFNLTVGTWTASEIDNAKFYLTAHNGASSTKRTIYIFGVSFTVNYTSSGKIYTYTIANVTGDHIIVVTETSTQTSFIYYKDGNTWVQASDVYKKVSGNWVLQSNLSNVFDSNTNYVKGVI